MSGVSQHRPAASLTLREPVVPTGEGGVHAARIEHAAHPARCTVRREPRWVRTMVLVALVSALVLAVSVAASVAVVPAIPVATAAAATTQAAPQDRPRHRLGGLNDARSMPSQTRGSSRPRAIWVLRAPSRVKSASDYEKNLGQLAQQKMDLTIGVGFLMADPVKNVAAKATESKFAIIDYSVTELGNPKKSGGSCSPSRRPDTSRCRSLEWWRTNGKLENLNGAKVVSAIGGQKIPPVDKYIAGFQAGVKAYCKDCEVLVDYSQDFLDQAKCQDRANAQISKNSDIIFQVAGLCGLGALDAAKTKGVWGIGVDADQAIWFRTS